MASLFSALFGGSATPELAAVSCGEGGGTTRPLTPHTPPGSSDEGSALESWRDTPTEAPPSLFRTVPLEETQREGGEEGVGDMNCASSWVTLTCDASPPSALAAENARHREEAAALRSRLSEHEADAAALRGENSSLRERAARLVQRLEVSTARAQAQARAHEAATTELRGVQRRELSDAWDRAVGWEEAAAALQGQLTEAIEGRDRAEKDALARNNTPSLRGQARWAMSKLLRMRSVARSYHDRLVLQKRVVQGLTRQNKALLADLIEADAKGGVEVRPLRNVTTVMRDRLGNFFAICDGSHQGARSVVLLVEGQRDVSGILSGPAHAEQGHTHPRTWSLQEGDAACAAALGR